MADENEKVEDQAEEGAEKKQKKDGGKEKDTKKAAISPNKQSSLRAWVLIALIVTVFSAGGGVAANIFLNPSSTPSETSGNKAVSEDILDKNEGETNIPEDFAYYEFEPLNANLNVQRQNRHIRVTVVLALINENEDKTREMLDKKKVELKNWIRTYMADLTLEQVAGRKNIVRIQREIADAINEQLWPNQRLRINHVLFKDFAVQ